MIAYEKIVASRLFGQYFVEKNGKWVKTSYRKWLKRIEKYNTTGK